MTFKPTLLGYLHFMKSILICFAIGTCMLVGCGKPKPDLVPASGVLTIGGQPAANIRLNFVPMTTDTAINAPSSHGVTDEQGRFTLRTVKDDLEGAVKGKHLVTFTDQEAGRGEQGEEVSNLARFDAQYGSNGIEVTVNEGEEIKIDIKPAR
jgi:hypothetical protein